MTTSQDINGELRAAFAQRELTNAKNSLSNGVPGLIVRAALITLFMNLLVIAYVLMGTTGLVFISVLFLLALLTPLFAQMAKKLWIAGKEDKQAIDHGITPEVQSES